MNGRVTLLAGLLITQLLLVLLVSLQRETDGPSSGLLDLDPGAVDQLVITDNEDASLSLNRGDSGWQLNLGEVSIAADGLKVNGVLERLAGLDGLWPVASSDSSRERFEVAEDRFQRRLSITGDTVDAVVYLGTSPGYRRIHASSGDSDNVYSIEFAAYEVPTEADEWLDKTQLQLLGISGLSLVDGWVLTQREDAWLVDGQAADQSAAAQIINRVEQLRLLGVYQGDGAGLGAPRQLLINVGEDVTTWSLQHDEQADEYVLTSSTRPGRFTIAAYIAEQILVSRESLLPGAQDQAVGADEEPEAAEVPPLLRAPE